MASFTISQANFVKLYNTLHSYYNRIDDRKNIIICENYEEAIQQYMADMMIQILNHPDENMVELNILFSDEWHEAEFRQILIAEELA